MSATIFIMYRIYCTFTSKFRTKRTGS